MTDVVCWLLEIHGPMYLHTARSSAGGGFTHNPFDAQRFPTRADAEAERDRRNGAFGVVPVEHIFYE